MFKSESGFALVSGFNRRVIKGISMSLANWWMVLSFTLGWIYRWPGAWSAEILCTFLMWSDGGCWDSSSCYFSKDVCWVTENSDGPFLTVISGYNIENLHRVSIPLSVITLGHHFSKSTLVITDSTGLTIAEGL